MGEAGILVEGGRLADDLVAALDGGLQDALNHPTRRGILRVLHESGRPRSVTEVLHELRPLRAGEVDYHVRVLQAADCVAVEGTRPAPGGGERLLRSTLADSDQALLVLRVTRRSDREHRQEADSSSNLRTMFRMPWPGRTVSLRSSKRREMDR